MIYTLIAFAGVVVGACVGIVIFALLAINKDIGDDDDARE